MEAFKKIMFKLLGHSSKTERSDETKQSYLEQSSNSDLHYPAANEDIPDLLPEISANESPEISKSDSMAQDIEEGRLSGYIGHGTTLAGETSFQKMLRVDGHLTGRITSDDGTLIVGTSGQVDANIVVATAVINGKVNGDIIATKKLQLVRTAQVVGNIQTPRLVVEDGALVEGNCSMIKSRETPPTAQNGRQPPQPNK
jgi:cytoskeletal protein CcmA (bactofilin family)